MSRQRTEALILRVVDYQETDRIVSLYTRDLGKVSALARHAVKSKKRFGTQLNLFQQVAVELRQKPNRSLAFLEQVKPLHSWVGIYQDWRRIAAACVVADLVNEMTREGSVIPAIYDGASAALQELDRGAERWRTLAVFQYELLAASGFRPAIDQCAVCHVRWREQQGAYWVQGAGGMHCQPCLPHNASFEVVPASQLAALQSVLRGTSDPTVEEGLAAALLLYQFIRHELGHPVRAWQFLEQMGMAPSSQ